MAILNLVTDKPGQIGVQPRRVEMITTDDLSTLTAAGYMSTSISAGLPPIEPSDIFDVLYDYNTLTGVGTYGEFTPSFSGSTITLVAVPSENIPAGSVGTTQLADGAVTAAKLASNSVSTVKIQGNAVTIGKLASGIIYSAMVVLDGKYTNAGGSATVTIPVSGAISSDKVLAEIESSANAVAKQKVTASTDTITVLCSGDPGASVITWLLFRAPS